MFSTRRKITFIAVPALLAVAVAALATKHGIIPFFKSDGSVSVESMPVQSPKLYDKTLLAKLDTVMHSVDFSRNAYTISGSISVSNKADSSENMNNANFLICKKGGEFYYREGPVETINEGGFYICIDKDTRKVIVSEQKEINAMSIINKAAIRKAIESENYELRSIFHGPLQVISLVNEHHVSCKEYAMTFDTLTNKINRIYNRMTNLSDPLNKAKDKIIDIRINRCETDADLSLYPGKNKVLRKDGNKWILTSEYSKYKLLVM